MSRKVVDVTDADLLMHNPELAEQLAIDAARRINGTWAAEKNYSDNMEAVGNMFTEKHPEVADSAHNGNVLREYMTTFNCSIEKAYELAAADKMIEFNGGNR